MKPQLSNYYISPDGNLYIEIPVSDNGLRFIELCKVKGCINGTWFCHEISDILRNKYDKSH